jgi:hypothetical protein
MNACSRAVAFGASSRARCSRLQASALLAGSMAALTCGPSTSDAPHQHIAQAGSSSVALRKARSAASWLKP